MHILKLTGPRLEILRDAKGPYGIGFVGNCQQLVARHTRPAHSPDYRLPALIVRPDRLEEAGKRRQVYQRIFKHAAFRESVELDLYYELLTALLMRHGLNLPALGEGRPKWWSDDPKQQAKNRLIYHGAKRRALGIVNKLIAELLGSAAHKDALRITRRYIPKWRNTIYRASARSLRAGQLAETFPVLALNIFASGSKSPADQARRAVEDGRPLRGIAEIMGIPMSLRKVAPGAAAHITLDNRQLFHDMPNLIHESLPQALPAQRRWLWAIEQATALGTPYVGWVGRNAAKLGNTRLEIESLVSDLRDWVRASYRASVPDHVLTAIQDEAGGFQPNGAINRGGRRFVTRQFSPDMSLKTVLALSNEWHDAVADSGEIEGGNFEFPPQWLADGEADGYQIKAITNNADLYREGREMHHCVGTFSGEVKEGRCYMYSVSKDGEKVATFELIRGRDNTILGGQIRGKQNKHAAPPIDVATRKWLVAHKRRQGGNAPEIEHSKPAAQNFPPGWLEANAFTVPATLDDELPF